MDILSASGVDVSTVKKHFAADKAKAKGNLQHLL